HNRIQEGCAPMHYRTVSLYKFDYKNLKPVLFFRYFDDVRNANEYTLKIENNDFSKNRILFEYTLETYGLVKDIPESFTAEYYYNEENEIIIFGGLYFEEFMKNYLNYHSLEKLFADLMVNYQLFFRIYNQPIIKKVINKNKITGFSTGRNIRIRSSYGNDFKIIDVLDIGEEVQIIDISENKHHLYYEYDYWYKIKTRSGIIGWVFGFYISSEINFSDVFNNYLINQDNDKNKKYDLNKNVVLIKGKNKKNYEYFKYDNAGDMVNRIKVDKNIIEKHTLKYDGFDRVFEEEIVVYKNQQIISNIIISYIYGDYFELIKEECYNSNNNELIWYTIYEYDENGQNIISKKKYNNEDKLIEVESTPK
ncbi:MAG: SH3 domain-containing protein, partial [Spirochaetes bacterium]|nr:SH3 domain-containing protein [Spirochaetota bacterium]